MVGVGVDNNKGVVEQMVVESMEDTDFVVLVEKDTEFVALVEGGTEFVAMVAGDMEFVVAVGRDSDDSSLNVFDHFYDL